MMAVTGRAQWGWSANRRASMHALHSGVRVSSRLDKLGMRSSDTAQVQAVASGGQSDGMDSSQRIGVSFQLSTFHFSF